MSNKYGSQWYLHYDGKPPEDDDKAYLWNGVMWCVDYDYEAETDRLIEYSEKHGI